MNKPEVKIGDRVVILKSWNSIRDSWVVGKEAEVVCGPDHEGDINVVTDAGREYVISEWRLVNSAPVEFTTEELRTLHVILGSVGGNLNTSPRKHLNSAKEKISNALGVGKNGFDQHPEYLLCSGWISLKDYPKPELPHEDHPEPEILRGEDGRRYVRKRPDEPFYYVPGEVLSYRLDEILPADVIVW